MKQYRVIVELEIETDQPPETFENVLRLVIPFPVKSIDIWETLLAINQTSTTQNAFLTREGY
jgi:hypothetical protein